MLVFCQNRSVAFCSGGKMPPGDPISEIPNQTFPAIDPPGIFWIMCGALIVCGGIAAEFSEQDEEDADEEEEGPAEAAEEVVRAPGHLVEAEIFSDGPDGEHAEKGA